MRLFCFGLGYSARRFIALHGAQFDSIAGTVRDGERAASLSRNGIGGFPVTASAFDGKAVAPDIHAALAETQALLVSVPPHEGSDPVLSALGGAIAGAPHLAAIVYLSTIGLYGDHGGAWVDETTVPSPVSLRSRARLAAEQAWQGLSARAERPVAILRLAGIYGPGRNPLINLARGGTRRIVKPGQVFNRIHVTDIAQAIDAAFARRADGVFNVADDEPAAGDEVLAFAAELAGFALPPVVAFDEAAKTMTAMALSFYGENKRVSNVRLKRDLGVALAFPTYREGMTALHAAGDGAAAPA